jgi:hypothetical protein
MQRLKYQYILTSKKCCLRPIKSAILDFEKNPTKNAILTKNYCGGLINEEREQNSKKPFPSKERTSSRGSMYQKMTKSPLGGNQ